MKVDRFGQRVRRPPIWQVRRLVKYLLGKFDRWRDSRGYNYDE